MTPSKYLVSFFSSELVSNVVEHYIYVSIYLYDYIDIKSLHQMNFRISSDAILFVSEYLE